MKIKLLLVLISLSNLCFSQVINYTPTFVCNLSDTTIESSGLIYINKTVWTHNDSGGKPELYQIDTLTGFVKRTVYIKNTTNIDWEDLAQSPTHVFIGNFGNNYGNRTNLTIYRVSKIDLLNLLNDSIIADTIQFYYQDQTVFTSTLNANNYDCEAFIFMNDSLHLFSKSWITQNTKHYILPSTIGNHTAILSDSFNVDGLITSADINQTNGNIVLLGYKKVGFNYNCFAWLLFNYSNHNFLKADKRRLELGVASTLGQTEGIVMKNDNTGYFSSERIVSAFGIIPQQLYKFDFSSYFNTTSLNENSNINEYKIYPNPICDYLIIDLKNTNNIYSVEIIDTEGQCVYKCQLNAENHHEINLQKLKSGLYFLIIKGNSGIFTQKIIIE